VSGCAPERCSASTWPDIRSSGTARINQEGNKGEKLTLCALKTRERKSTPPDALGRRGEDKVGQKDGGGGKDMIISRRAERSLSAYQMAS